MARSRWIAPGVGPLSLAVVLLLVMGGHAQQPGTESQAPVFRTGINVVRVDVIVSDRTGQPIADLRPTDFEVTEDGRPQTVDQFKFIRLDGGLSSVDERPRTIRTDADEEAEAGRADVRLFGVFLDDYHVRRENSVLVRAPLSRFVETQLGPSDMIGLMYPLQPVSTIRMSRNHAVIVGAIQQFDGRKYDYRPRNLTEEQYVYYPAETVETIRNQVSLSALKSLIMHMGSLKEARKALIVVSEGYSSLLPPQLRDPVAAIPGIGNPDRHNPTAGLNDLNESRAQFAGRNDMELRLREVYDTANKYNVAIYTLDPRGLAVAEFDMSQPNIAPGIDRDYLNASIDTLRVLANETDGRAIVNRNDLDGGLKQIVRDSSAYYLLGYNTSQASDGKFHEIKVRVKRPGVQVRARKGYWALTAEDVKKALTPRQEPPKAFTNALATISQPAAAHSVIRTWVGASRGANGKTKVTFVWEPTPRAGGARSSAPVEAPARVMLTAVAPDGSPYFRGRITDRATFDAAPGKMQLRVSVEGAASQVLDSVTREIAVPDLTASAATLGTPEVFRARTARELQQIKDAPDAVPLAAREFSRTERLLIRVPVYAQETTMPTVTARLLNRDGNPMSDLPVSASATTTVQQIELALASMPPGEYILEIKAADGASGGATELVAFRVTS